MAQINYHRFTGCMVVLLLVFAATPAHGQFQQPPQPQQAIDVSDEELQLFLDASLKAQEIQMELQMEMIAIVEDEGLEVQTYNDILEGLQMGASPEDMDMSTEEIEKFENASDQIGEIEEEMEVKLIATIEDEGMDLDRYQEIFAAIQTDPELQQKLQAMIREVQMQQEQPGDF